jgi:hypothetical protein
LFRADLFAPARSRGIPQHVVAQIMKLHLTMFTVTAIGLSVWGAASVRAECIAPGDWWLRDKHVELVFSGRVVTVTRTAGDATRSTFVVDGVWKGDVPARIDLYEWEGIGEVDRVVVEQRYLVGAMCLTWMRMREAVGLGKAKRPRSLKWRAGRLLRRHGAERRDRRPRDEHRTAYAAALTRIRAAVDRRPSRTLATGLHMQQSTRSGV